MIDPSLLPTLQTLYPQMIGGVPAWAALWAIAGIESDWSPGVIGDNGASFSAWQVNAPTWNGKLSFPPPESITEQAAWIRPVVEAMLASAPPINPPRWWRWGRSDAPEQPIDTVREQTYARYVAQAMGQAPPAGGSPAGGGPISVAGASGVGGALLALLFLLWLLLRKR